MTNAIVATTLPPGGQAGDAPVRSSVLGFLAAVLRAHPSFGVGYGIVLAVIVASILVPWLSPYDPVQAQPRRLSATAERGALARH